MSHEMNVSALEKFMKTRERERSPGETVIFIIEKGLTLLFLYKGDDDGRVCARVT